jgi:hypothetical protein
MDGLVAVGEDSPTARDTGSDLGQGGDTFANAFCLLQRVTCLSKRTRFTKGGQELGWLKQFMSGFLLQFVFDYQ